MQRSMTLRRFYEVCIWCSTANNAVIPKRNTYCRFRWPSGPRRGSAAARLLGLRVRISSETWMSVSFECCVLSSRCLCLG